MVMWRISFVVACSCRSAGGHLLSDVGLASSPQVGAAMIRTCLGDGSAMDKFRAMIETQGVDSGTAHALCKPGPDVFQVLPPANYKTDVLAPTAGLVSTQCSKACSHKYTLRYDTIDDLHWKTDRQAASLI